jgi:hypothetical protein
MKRSVEYWYLPIEGPPEITFRINIAVLVA